MQLNNTLVFVTGNKGKAKEAQELIGFPLSIVDVTLEEIQSLNLREIVKHKVISAYQIVKKPVIVEDVSVEFEAWNGFPGPFMKFIGELGGPKLITHMLRNEDNRKMTAMCTIGYYDGSEIRYFEGKVTGTIARIEKGEHGFGWDSIFMPEGYVETFAELDGKIKNKISHRAQAYRKLNEYLRGSDVTPV